jgi:hypothetical protein
MVERANAEWWLNATWITNGVTMTISSGKASEPSSDYALIGLATEARTDGSSVQHFVCYECGDLVEREAGSGGVHRCFATAQESERTVQRENLKFT